VLLDDAFVDISCPRCGYIRDVEFLDVRLERRIFCPACKAVIELKDGGASVDASFESVDRAMGDLMKTLDKLGRRH
jgi:phage FluMu protein Com